MNCEKNILTCVTWSKNKKLSINKKCKRKENNFKFINNKKCRKLKIREE